jgi:hypothetical protein
MQVGDYRIEPVFGRITAELNDEIVQFWLGEGALADPDVARARTRQVVCIARGASGSLASVSTVYLRTPQWTDELHYFYRMFTRRQDRVWQLSAGMLRACVEVMTKTPLRHPRARGIVIVASNPKLRTPAGRRVLTGMGWTYVGQTAEALDVWRMPFPGALCPKAPAV